MQGKIAIFLPSLNGGGAERSMVKLANGISEAGRRVDIVMARAEGPYLLELDPRVGVIGLESKRDLHSIFPLARYLRRERPAALLAALHGNIIAVLAKWLSGIPTRVVVSQRNMIGNNVQQNLQDYRMRLMPYLLRVCFRRADAVIAVSQGVADEVRELMRLPEGRVKVIYNPIVTPEMKRRHPPCRRRAGQPPTVIAIGRLTPQKDFSTLIHAFAIVRRERKAKLLILGQGEEHDVLQRLVASYGIQDDVEMIGFKADPLPYLFSAAAFVLSSRWEGLPGVLIEALFCGVPVISTDCPSGPREILKNGEYGRLVPVGNAALLAAAIKDALDGHVPAPPEESWFPYDAKTVANQYLQVLNG